jgi:deazaflavin-dependent oxidoreductase (nitroreductase family)
MALEALMSGEDDAEVYRWAPADLGELEVSAVGDSPALAAINDDVVQQFRANNGTIVKGLFAGMRGLLLHTVGAKSGGPRLTPLYRFDFQGRWYVIGSDGGSAKAPAWVHNLRAVSQACVEVGSKTGTGTVAYKVRVRELSEPERGRVWGELRGEIPHIDGFQAKTSRVIPVFELSKQSHNDETEPGAATDHQ